MSGDDVWIHVMIQPYVLCSYSGDTDGCVPYVGTEKWTRGMNSSLVTDWHQWLSKPNFEHGLTKAGYAVTYDKFQFITVNGAGHMVPQVKPMCVFSCFLFGNVFFCVLMYSSNQDFPLPCLRNSLQTTLSKNKVYCDAFVTRGIISPFSVIDVGR